MALEVIEKNFPQFKQAWEPKLKEMIPSYGQSLIEDTKLLHETRKATAQALELNEK